MDLTAATICQQLRQARRAKGLTQVDLARRVGCQQSAISMLEAGQVAAVARATLEKIAAEVGVTLAAAADAASAAEEARAVAGWARCPDPECPSNVPYVVSGALLFWSRPQPADTGRHCAWCGEVLTRACPACGAPAGVGACCRLCGAPYVTPPATPAADGASWAAARRRELEAMRTLLANGAATGAL
jgi:transcriptional regulator with XRE-family HTH domain